MDIIDPLQEPMSVADSSRRMDHMHNKLHQTLHPQDVPSGQTSFQQGIESIKYQGHEEKTDLQPRMIPIVSKRTSPPTPYWIDIG